MVGMASPSYSLSITVTAFIIRQIDLYIDAVAFISIVQVSSSFFELYFSFTKLDVRRLAE